MGFKSDSMVGTVDTPKGRGVGMMILGLDILNLKCSWHLQLKMPRSQFCMSIWSVALPRWLSSKKSSCQCGRPRFDPWVRNIPWRREWQPTSLFLPWTEEPDGLQSMGLQRVRHD